MDCRHTWQEFIPRLWFDSAFRPRSPSLGINSARQLTFAIGSVSCGLIDSHSLYQLSYRGIKEQWKV